MIHVTRRLILRPLVTADEGWIARDISRPEVQHWLTGPPHPYGIDEARAFITACAEAPGIRVVEASGAACGVVSIMAHRSAGPDQRELGYWLAPRAWGKGYMTEAARTLIDWYFQTGGGMIHSGWIDGNAASQNVLRKLGFVRTGETQMRHAPFLARAVPVIRVQLDKDRWRALEKRCETG